MLTMASTSNLLGWLAAALLFAALAAWLKTRRGTWVPRPNRSAATRLNVENASRLLVIALIVSAAAASLGVAAWMFG